MSEAWAQRRIGDLGTVVTGTTPSSKMDGNWGSGADFLTPTDMPDVGYLVSSRRRLSEQRTSDFAKRLLPPGSVAVSCIASIGKVARITRDTVTNQQVNALIPHAEIIDPLFTFYWLRTVVPKLHKIASGSVAKIVNKTDFANLEMPLPPLDEQRRIAGVLGALDELIEVNLRLAYRNSELAETLWKSAASNAECEMRIADCATVVLGGTPSRKELSCWSGDIAWLNSGKANEFRVIEPSERITALGLAKSSTKLMPVGATIIAITGATLGQVSRIEIPACGNQSLVGVWAEEPAVNDYIYFGVRDRIEVLLRSATGGAQQHVNKANVEELALPWIPQDQLFAWHEVVGPLMRATAELLFEAKLLQNARDELLPLLMSGRIRVTEGVAA